MQLIVLGLNHKTVPVEVRERFAISADNIQQGLHHLDDYEGICEAVILSTCNRSEIYAVVDNAAENLSSVKDFFFALSGCDKAKDEYFYYYTDKKCIEQDEQPRPHGSQQREGLGEEFLQARQENFADVHEILLRQILAEELEIDMAVDEPAQRRGDEPGLPLVFAQIAGDEPVHFAQLFKNRGHHQFIYAPQQEAHHQQRTENGHPSALHAQGVLEKAHHGMQEIGQEHRHTEGEKRSLQQVNQIEDGHYQDADDEVTRKTVESNRRFEHIYKKE